MSFLAKYIYFECVWTLSTLLARAETFRFKDEDDYANRDFLNTKEYAREAAVFFGGKSDSCGHSTTGFSSRNKYQMLEVLSFYDRERA